MLRGLAAAALLLSPGWAWADAARLTGAWTAVEAQRDGAPTPDVLGHRITFTGDRFAVSVEDRLLYGGTYTTNPTARPAAIDFRHDRGEASGAAWEGIYRVDGDELTICDDAFDPAKGRPTDFVTAPGSGHVLITFRR